MDLSLLRGTSAVVEAVRSAAAVPVPAGGFESIWLDVPRGDSRSGAFGNPSELRVPRDARLERLARRWARDPGRSNLALKVLETFDRSPENVAALRAVLGDPNVVRRGAGKASHFHYPRRELASQLLRRWGVGTPGTLVEAPRDGYTPLRRWPLWMLAGLAAAPLAAAVLPLRRTAHARRSRRVRFAWGLAGVLGAAAVALAVLGSRSRSRVDEVTFRIGGARHWVTSFDRSVQWVFIRGWNGHDLPGDAPGGAYGSFPPGRPLDGLWKDDPKVVTSRSGRWGSKWFTVRCRTRRGRSARTAGWRCQPPR